jgi:hypothetical protein
MVMLTMNCDCTGAVATEHGEVYFSPDLYGHDEKLAELLSASRAKTGS